LAAGPATAQQFQYWDTATTSGLQLGDGTWNTTANLWSPAQATATAGPGTTLTTWVQGNNAYFEPGSNSGQLITLGETISVNDLRFNGSGGGNKITFTGGAGSEMRLSGTITSSNTPNNWDAITLSMETLRLMGNTAGNTSWTTGTAGILISANIIEDSASRGIIRNRSLTLSGNNTFSGGIQMTGDTLRINSATAIGSGTLTMSNATSLDNTSGAAITNTNNNSYVMNGATNTFIGTNSLNFGTGTVTLASSGGNVTRTINVNANTLTFGGALVNTGTGNNATLVKGNAGTLELNGANTYTGGTTISGGSLRTNSVVVSGGASGLGNASSAMTLGSAALEGRLEYTGNSTTYTRGFTIDGAGGGRLDVATAGQTLTVGTNNVSGTGAFTVGGAGNTRIESQLTHTGSLAAVGTGNLTLTGNNTYAGGTKVERGATVSAQHNNALGSGAVTLISGSSLLATNGITIGNDMITGQSSNYTQNFNTIASGMPVGWGVYTGASSSSLGTTEAFFNYSRMDWTANTTVGQFVVVTASTGLTSTSSGTDQGASTDRALGLRQTSTFGDPGAAIGYTFSTQGADVSSISFDMMLLNTQNRSTTFSFQYGTGANPTEWTTLGTWADPGTFGSTALSFNSGLSALSDQSNAVFRVVALNPATGTGNYDLVAIDNFSMTLLSQAASSVIGSTAAGASSTFSGGVTLNSNASLTAGSGGTVTFSGNLTGAGGVEKVGTGNVVLSGSSDYEGLTSVNAGMLVIGSTVGSTAALGTHATATVTVANTGTLAGNGTINRATTVSNGGILAPGTATSAGSLTFGANVTFESVSSAFNINLGGTGFSLGSSEEYDRIRLTTGILGLNDATLNLSLINAFTLDLNQAFGIAQLTGTATRSGFFSGLDEGALVGTFGGRDLFITYAGNVGDSGSIDLFGGNDIVLYTIPEPAFGALVLGGGIILLAGRRRRVS
jgi:fibronectin-binding autotransporter adhesin